MTLGRRSFLFAGGAAAGGGVLIDAAASASPSGQSSSVTDFGVEPDAPSDQTAALQKAVEAISGAGHAVYLPGGLYRISALRLPDVCAIVGAPGLTRIAASGAEPALVAEGAASLHLSGLAFEGGALAGSAEKAFIDAVAVNGAPGDGLALTGVRSLSVTRSTFENCAGAGMDVASEADEAQAVISGNRAANCRNGFVLKGTGHVMGNAVSGGSEFGLRLGGDARGGNMIASGNIITDCAVGIGFAANEETVYIALNLMTGVSGSGRSAIRAFDGGGGLIGPDLAYESAEAYLNVTIAGNVAR